MFGQNDVDAVEVDLASVWDFEPPGNLKDKHGLNHGTNYGTTDVVGKFGRGRLFVAASTQHIDFGNGSNLAPTSAFTLAALVKFTANVAATQAILGKHDSNNKRSYLLTANPTNSLRGIVSADGSNAAGQTSITTTANGVIVPGTWQLVMMTFSLVDKSIRIYVNNVDVSSIDSSNAAAIATFADVNFAHGATHASGVAANFLNATVDEVAMWRALLGSAARAGLYNGGNFRYWMPDLSPVAIGMPSLSFSHMARRARSRH